MPPVGCPSYFRISDVCKKLACIFVLWVFLGSSLVANPGSPSEIVNGDLNWIPLFMGLCGGLALFLYGMDQMSAGLKSAVGNKMKVILSRFTSNRFKAALTGSVVTAVIQSSSVTTVLIVGFVSAGLMTLSQSVGVIMGANVGTTLTAQIVAFKVQNAALALVAIGFALLFMSRRDSIKQLGNVLMGLGLVFLGMTLMSDGMNPLRSYQPFFDFMVTLRNPLLGILVGAVFTGLVQSSSATTGIVIALASQGLIELPTGISLIFGANVGTCFTAMLATLGKSREALRVALVHVIFNLVGVLIWFKFIPQFAEWIQLISPRSVELEGVNRLAQEVPRQIANAHAIFNIANTLLLLPFTTGMARLVSWLVPARKTDSVSKPQFLDEAVLAVPALALNNARLEIAQLGKRVCSIMGDVPTAIKSRDSRFLRKLAEKDDAVDQTQEAILKYIGKIRKMDLSDSSSEEIQRLIIMVDALERISDVVTNDIVEICIRKVNAEFQFSPQLTEMLLNIQHILEESISEAIELLGHPDPMGPVKIVERKFEIDRRLAEVFLHQEKRFAEDDSDRVPLFRLEMDLLEKQRRIFTLVQRIAEEL